MRSAPNAIMRPRLKALIAEGCSAEEISETMQIKLESIKRYMPTKKEKAAAKKAAAKKAAAKKAK